MDMYRSSDEDLLNPYFAPLVAPDFSNLPRTLVITAEYCPLRDEGEEYARCVRDAGGDVECYRMSDAIHGFLLYPKITHVVQNTYDVIRHFLYGEELEQEGEQRWLEIPGTA